MLHVRNTTSLEQLVRLRCELLRDRRGWDRRAAELRCYPGSACLAVRWGGTSRIKSELLLRCIHLIKTFINVCFGARQLSNPRSRARPLLPLESQDRLCRLDLPPLQRIAIIISDRKDLNFKSMQIKQRFAAPRSSSAVHSPFQNPRPLAVTNQMLAGMSRSREQRRASGQYIKNALIRSYRYKHSPQIIFIPSRTRGDLLLRRLLPHAWRGEGQLLRFGK